MVIISAANVIYSRLRECVDDKERQAYLSSPEYKQLQMVEHSSHILSTHPFSNLFRGVSVQECHIRYWRVLSDNGLTNPVRYTVEEEVENIRSEVLEVARRRSEKQSEDERLTPELEKIGKNPG